MSISFRLSALVILLAAACVQVGFAQRRSATLHSLNKYDKEERNFCLDFKTGVSSSRSEPCDVRYGALYAGEDWDWFQSSGDRNSRSVIKDLGLLTWKSKIKVPVVTPRLKLQPGETRTISIDVSGADGADGAPGAPGADADGVVRPRPANPPSPQRKKNDGVPKIDPIFVKAVEGHMYVARIVDGVQDFYALFRVEKIVRGDSVRVSWRIIDAPSESVPK